MNIFITGVAGFLGSNLAEFYLKKGFHVSGNDNLVGGDIENLNPKVEFYNCNCEDVETMTKITKGKHFLFHTAAYAHEGLSSFSPTLICNNNVTGSVSVFTAAAINKINRVVYCSSMARYGDIETPFQESSVTNPVDPYGASKVAAERILKILSKTHGFEYNIAVPHNIIGPNQKYNDPFRNVASIMINLMLQGRSPTIYGDGNQKRCFSDIEDCIYCLDKLMFDKNIKGEIFNIGPDEEYISINELFSKISNKMKFNKSAIYQPDRPNEVKYAYCSADKSRKILKYNTKVSLDTSLDKLIYDIKKRGPKKFEYKYRIEINNDLTPETWAKKIF